MDLGVFSVSLTVKDLAVSQVFYEKLGFAQIAGVPEQGWVVLQSGTTTIGLFHGMFERNMMTFNPGWSNEERPMSHFMDIREIQARLRAEGIEFEQEADEAGSGPAHFIIHDPDGNPIMLDQHV